jgi:hypothetical protein
VRTGSLATTTAVYRSDCACVALEQIARGEEAPECPACRRSVGWSYVRSTYDAGRQEGEATPGEHDTQDT